MKFTVGLPLDRVDDPDEFCTGAAVAAMARALEAAGADAAFVTDHPAPDQRWLAGGGHHAMEPTVALSFAAAATTTLAVHTHVYVLAYRNPFLAAKALGGLDRLSGGRLIVGVAAGYLRPEFASLGVEFDRRNELLDRDLALLPEIWSGAVVEVDDRDVRSRGTVMAPGPITEPHPPFWIGGNSRRAIRRAAQLGQGWSPFPTTGGIDGATKTGSMADLGDLAAGIDALAAECEAAGRAERLDVCFGPFAGAAYAADGSGAAALVDEIGALGGLGVTWAAVNLRGRTLAEYLEAVERFGTEVVAPLRG